MENIADIGTKTLSDLEDESFRSVSDLQMSTWDAVSGGDSMMVAMFQNSEFLQSKGSQMNGSDFTEVHSSAEQLIDQELLQEEQHLKDACNAFQEFINGSLSCGWSDINRVRNLCGEMKQRNNETSIEKQEILTTIKQESDEVKVLKKNIKIIYEGLNKQLTEKKATHAKLKADADLLIREMDSLNASLAKKKVACRPKNMELLYSTPNNQSK
ncbi:uncharacterized protein LOC131682491 isoform X2 [Topomyia yanbarensis]|uniref:uncharacterized protein LOC131682491 isoform X2 n=1 Tax=Topomyia yanbarensis TaxID=2498891 RepID=UPI00273A9BA4|nr:uncharacterized protein LOC131682491 isoform X2 [Topomyia yanbarensis]